MPRKYFRKYLPAHETIRENHYVRWFGPWLQHPNLWHLNRRSVSGGLLSAYSPAWCPALCK